jgi:hypothetical protein
LGRWQSGQKIPSNDFPQFWQKGMPDEIGLSQCGQVLVRLSWGSPQTEQNLAPGRTTLPHFKQFIATLG